MPVGIAPQTQKDKGVMGNNGSLLGSFAASVSSSVGIYSKATRSSHSFRLREPASPGSGSGRPPNRRSRASTPKFNEKERAVIANLDQLSPAELDDLNQRLYASRVAKLRELRMAQNEKAALQVKLQDTLTELADSRQTAQQAASSLKADRKFVSTILRKYQVLVDRFEAQKAETDLADHDEMSALRASLSELHKQMLQAKNLSRVLTELERTKVETGQLTNLLKFHKVDLAIVQAGSRQALSKAKAHKDALFQALVGLERQLMSAKTSREQKLAEIAASRVQEKSMSAQVASEEEAVLEREVAWLQTQVTGAQEAIDSYSSPDAMHKGPKTHAASAGGEPGESSGKQGKKKRSTSSGEHSHAPDGDTSLGYKVSQRADLQVKLLKYQVEELERQISEVKMEGLAAAPSPDATQTLTHPGTIGAEASAGSLSMQSAVRRRPLTAAADGLDRRRTAGERAMKLEASLAQLKAELIRAELTVERDGVPEDGAVAEARGLSEARRMSILAHMEAIEKELELSDTASLVEQEKVVLAGELEWLEGLINEAEKGHASDTGDVQNLQRLLQNDAVKTETVAMVAQLAVTRTQLVSAMSIAESARSDLEALLRVGEGGVAEGQLVEKVEALGVALTSAMAQMEDGKRSQDLLGQRLAASESCVVQQQREILALRSRMQGVAPASASGAHNDDDGMLEAAALREENLALEKELQETMDANNHANAQVRALEAQLRHKERKPAADEGIEEPEDEPSEEHALRTRLRREQADGHDYESGLQVGPADVAELALVWGMDTTAHLHLLWLPERSLRSALPVGWRELLDKRGQVFYHETAAHFSTYMHPNDTKYCGMFLEIRSMLEPVDALGRRPPPTVNPQVLELERLRLREAAAAIDRQAREVRKEKEALSRDRLGATLSLQQLDEHKLREWEAKKEEELRLEIARLRDEEVLQLQKAKEKMLVEVRQQLEKNERDKIRADLLAEEKNALAIERLKLRQKIIKEETAAVRQRILEEETSSIDSMREQIRDELRAGIKREEEMRVAAEAEEEALLRGKYVKTPKDKQQEARVAQVEAARKYQQSLDKERRVEIEEYAQYLGMHPSADEHLLWIAEMALTAPLPAGWSEHQDSSGNVFFFNKASGASTYEHPLDASFKSYYSKIKASGS